MRTYIAGVGRYMPERIVTSEDLERQAGYERFGLKIGLCRMLSGCVTRHYAADDEACSDLAAKAGKIALQRAGLSPDEVDAVLFCSVTQDFAEPATANVVAYQLGIDNGFAFDVKNACNAFIQGVDIADSLIKSGKAKTVLVTSGEVLSRWIKQEYDDAEELKQAAPVVLTMGDAGGAFVMRASDDEARGIVASVFHTKPKLWNNNVMWGGGVIFPRDPEKMYIPGTTKNLIDASGDCARHIVPEILKASGWTLDDIDYIVPGQGAIWLGTYISKVLGIPADRAMQVVDHTGNIGASGVPVTFDEAMEQGRLRPGSKVLLTSGAVGLSYAAMTVVI